MSRNIDAEHFDERVRLAVGVVFGDLTNDFQNGILATLEMLKTEPAADVKPLVRGEWINGCCSKCGEQALYRNHYEQGGYYLAELFYSDYCPNCGADMRGEENE